MGELLERAYNQLSGKLIGWYDTVFHMLPNLVLALLIVVFFAKFSLLVRRMVRHVLDRTVDNVAIGRLTTIVIYYLTWTWGIFTALNVLHLDTTVTSLLAGAGVLGLALSFAFQDLATNFISGVFIAIERPFKIGDFVESNGFVGHIERIGVRSVIIKTLDEQHVIIPSKDIFQQPLKNYNIGRDRLVTLDIGVSYAEDLVRVANIAKAAVSGMEEVVPERKIHVHYNQFADSSINFELRFWISRSDQMSYLFARSQAVIAVKSAFDKNKVTIPFPIRTLDFGIKGGKDLRTMTDGKSPEA